MLANRDYDLIQTGKQQNAHKHTLKNAAKSFRSHTVRLLHGRVGRRTTELVESNYCVSKLLVPSGNHYIDSKCCIIGWEQLETVVDRTAEVTYMYCRLPSSPES